MANIELKFMDYSSNGDYISCDLEVDVISLKGVSFEDDFFIELDVSTAIKLSKQLRTVINEAKEVNHG